MIGNHSSRLHFVDTAGHGWATVSSTPTHAPIDEPAELRPTLGSLINQLVEQLFTAGAQLPPDLASGPAGAAEDLPLSTPTLFTRAGDTHLALGMTAGPYTAAAGLLDGSWLAFIAPTTQPQHLDHAHIST